jgi:hypothetical protein
MVPMRKTADLVNEMFDVAKGARLVAIAVGFENETEFVFSTTPHPLEKLNALVAKGGSPVGLLRFEREGTGLQGSYRPFLEYENEAWAKEYLAGLLKEAAEIVALSQQQPMFPPAY